LHGDRDHRLLRGRPRRRARRRRRFALAAYGVAAEDAARDANGPGTFHARLYDALYALTPESLERTSKHRRSVKLHCIIEDEEAAQVAAAGGATVIQLRIKGVSTLDLVERGPARRSGCAQGRNPVRRQRRRRGCALR
jgi:hypothetical protein